VSFSSTKIKVNTNVERRNRLRTRRELKKAQKRHKQYLREQAKIGAGNPTATQSVQEIIIDDIMHGLALHPDTRHTILEEDESTQIPESANSGENEPAASLDVQSPIPSGEDNRTIHIPASGEEEAQPTVLPENGGSEPYISFDVEPSPPRKDPLLPSPALKEPNLVVRRSARNVNKPSRFRALMAHTTALLMTPTIPHAGALVATHDHMVPLHPYANGSTEDWTHDHVNEHTWDHISHAQREYVRLCDMHIDTILDPVDHRIWTPLRMTAHRVIKRNGTRRAMAKVNWLTDYPSWIPISVLRQEHPFLVIDYTLKTPILLRSPDFCWIKEYADNADKLRETRQTFKASTERTPKFKFGVEVPTSIRHALLLDKQNGNHLWEEAIEKELKQLNDYKTFRRRRHGERLDEYTRIPYHCVFDVKFDGRRKCRLVAGGITRHQRKNRFFLGSLTSPQYDWAS
jgi:hypothetical protein